MTLILSNALVNTLHFSCIYMSEGNLVLEGSSTVVITNVPSDVLPKVAVAVAEGKEFLELENADLLLEDTDEE